jgi:uncharacterized membrane protein YdjX (TVP38/TMEM64 family)
MSFKKISTAALIIAIISCFFIFDLGHYLSLDYFLSQRDEIIQYAADQPVLSAATFFALYVLVTAFSLPAAAVITLAGGAIFGLWKGLLLVSFASTIGATLAFLMARTVLRDYVENKFSHMLSRVNEGIAKEGSFLSFRFTLGPTISVLCGEPFDGTRANLYLALFYRKSGRDAARYIYFCQRRYAACSG